MWIFLMMGWLSTPPLTLRGSEAQGRKPGRPGNVPIASLGRECREGGVRSGVENGGAERQKGEIVQTAEQDGWTPSSISVVTRVTVLDLHRSDH